MNAILKIEQPAVGANDLSMTSREIAVLCEKEHKNVMADIRNMLDQLEIDSADFSAQYKDSTGRSLPCFNLPKDLTLTLVSGYNVQMRKRIIDRWLELESAVAAPDPMKLLTDPAAMRGLLLSYTEKVIELESTVKELEPKADALDQIATSDGSMCLRDAAKTLQCQEKKFIQFLVSHNWIYRRAGASGYCAYADKIHSLVMEHKVTTGEKSDGSEWVNTQARVTAKGLAKLSELLGQNQQKAA